MRINDPEIHRIARMPLDSNGNFIPLPGALNAAPATKIKSQSQHNDLWADAASVVSAKLDADGRKPMSGALKMGGNRITGVGNGITLEDVVSVDQTQSGVLNWGGVASGTANALTISLSPARTSYPVGMIAAFQSGAAANTGAVTISVNGSAAQAVNRPSGAPLVAGDIPANSMVQIIRASSTTWALFPILATDPQDIIYDFGGVGDGVANDAPALAAGLATGASVKLSSDKTWKIEPNQSDASTILRNLERVIPEGEITITLPSGVNSVSSGDIAKVGPNGAKIKIIGTAPVLTTISSVDSVTGTSGNYSVAINVASAVGIEVGNWVKLQDVVPLLHLSGDKSVFRARVAKNELLRWSALMAGNITTVAGSNTFSFSSVSAGVLADYVQPGDLLTVMGQTREVATLSVSSGTVNGDAWQKGVSSSRDYYLSRPNSGTVSTADVYSTSVAGTGTLFGAEANPGDILLCEGQFAVITGIPDSLSLTVSPAIKIPAGSKYSIISPGASHEGVHEVIAVSGNQITVRNRWRGAFAPAARQISGGDVIAIKTILRNTGSGDGFSFGESGALAYLDNVVLVGSSASSGTHGIALNGRQIGGATQRGTVASCQIGDNVGISGWGRGAFVGHGCVLQARSLAISGCVDFGAWLMESATFNAREIIISGTNGRGLYVNAGSIVLGTEMQCHGNASDGVVVLEGGTFYGEIPMFWGNIGMNIRATGASFMHLNEGVSGLSSQSGIYASNAKGDLSRMLIICNSRNNIELLDGSSFDAEGITSAGCRGGSGNGHGALVEDSVLRAKQASFNNNNGRPFEVFGLDASLTLTSGFVAGATSGRSTLHGRARLSSSILPSIAVATGARVFVDGVSPAPSVSGVARINEMSNDGSLVTDLAGSSHGFQAIQFNGNEPFSFFRRGTVVFDYPSIAAGGSAFTDIPVTGVIASGHVALANSNSMQDGIVLSARIPTNGTVRIFAHNPSTAAINPGNATISWVVMG